MRVRYLVISFCALVFASVFAQTKYPIYMYGWSKYPDNTVWRNFADLESLGVDAILYVDYQQVDFDSAPPNLRLMQQLTRSGERLAAQQSIYEADSVWEAGPNAQIIPYYFSNGYFGSARIGRQVTEENDPSVINQRAWYASASSGDTAGIILRGLRNLGYTDYPIWETYNKEQGKQFFWQTEPLKFCATFRLKTTQPTDNFVMLSVVVKGQSGDSVILASRLIQPGDFAPPGVYETFEVWFTKADTILRDYHLITTDYRIWWGGVGDIWVDRITVEDTFAYAVNKHAYDSEQGAYVDARPQIFRWYLNDEPILDQFKTTGYWNSFLRNRGAGPGITAFASPDINIFDYYIASSNPEEFWLDKYVLLWDTDTTSEYLGGNLQQRWDDLINTLDSGRVVAHAQNKPFVYIPQSFEGYDFFRPPGSQLIWRYPTQYEQKALVWIGIAYGCDALAYFTYESRYADCTCEPYPCGMEATCVSTLKPRMPHPVARPYEPPPYYCPPADSPFYFFCDTVTWNAHLRGLTYWDPLTQHFQGYEPLWSSVREVNLKVDSLAYVIADSNNWLGASKESLAQYLYLSKSGESSYLDSVELEHNPWTEDVEVAFFRDSSSTKSNYFLLVNRRCLSYEGGMFRAYFNKPNVAYRIYDAYTGAFVDSVIGLDYARIQLGPGEGKLLKLKTFAPFNLTATALFPKGIKLSWNDPLNATTYLLDRMDSTSISWTLAYAALSATDTVFYDTASGNLLGSETYSYRIRAISGSDTMYSNIAIAHNYPNKPTNLGASIVKAVCGDGPMMGPGNQVNTNRVKFTWTAASNQKPGTVYYYQVKAESLETSDPCFASGVGLHEGSVGQTSPGYRCFYLNTKYYFSLRTIDIFGHVSEYASEHPCATTGNCCYCIPCYPDIGLSAGKPLVFQDTTLPTVYSVSQNYPNPFNQVTQIRYALPRDSEVRIDIFNIRGQRVREFDLGLQSAGYKAIIWDGRNQSGDIVSSGIYFYRIKAGESIETKRMTLLK